ncbi:DUF397 domain-containing protein [Streptomyces sp. WAC07149]|uniref:DUF397 domain-containing protein n=1 Tax=Streptomyces sp. WAC07149 TaxID=2487425 RepID=UPI000F79B36E|nr:DUF397 domain-containing protein [Streptomyces sp. WAC07149]RST02940.1 DUF397 domain-containing protein [Streptomyces sp. WAC07149]
MHPGPTAIVSAFWIKSSHSGAEHSECVEVAFLAGSTAVRDSKRPTSSTVSFRNSAWQTFLAELQSQPT